MSVISDSKTALEMRHEVVTELERQLKQERAELASRWDATTNKPGPGHTRADIAFRRGRISALDTQLSFWTHLWVSSEQYKAPAPKAPEAPPQNVKTLAEAKDIVGRFGFSLSKRDGEYRLAPNEPGLAPIAKEAMAYYSDDLNDIVGTAFLSTIRTPARKFDDPDSPEG